MASPIFHYFDLETLLIHNDRVLVGAGIITVVIGIGMPVLLAFLNVAEKASDVVADWIIAGGTVALGVVAAIQFRGIIKTSNADFIHRLNTDFYTDKARPIRQYLRNPKLMLNVEDGNDAQFELEKRPVFSGEDLDDLILGPLEAVGIFYFKGVIDLPTTYEMFGWYMMEIWETNVVCEYIKLRRGQTDGEDVYDQFEKLVRECRRYQAEKLRLAAPRRAREI